MTTLTVVRLKIEAVLAGEASRSGGPHTIAARPAELACGDRTGRCQQLEARRHVLGPKHDLAQRLGGCWRPRCWNVRHDPRPHADAATGQARASRDEGCRPENPPHR